MKTFPFHKMVKIDSDTGKCLNCDGIETKVKVLTGDCVK